MYTVIGAPYKFECFQIVPITVHISVSINHTLMNFRRFYILGNNNKVKLLFYTHVCSLIMVQ